VRDIPQQLKAKSRLSAVYTTNVYLFGQEAMIEWRLANNPRDGFAIFEVNVSLSR
jgi:hypothetical protein